MFSNLKILANDGFIVYCFFKKINSLSPVLARLVVFARLIVFVASWKV